MKYDKYYAGRRLAENTDFLYGIEVSTITRDKLKESVQAYIVDLEGDYKGKLTKSQTNDFIKSKKEFNTYIEEINSDDFCYAKAAAMCATLAWDKPASIDYARNIGDLNLIAAIATSDDGMWDT